MNLVNGLTCNDSHSSVVRTSDQCTEGHRFESCQGVRFFLSHACVMKNIASFSFYMYCWSQSVVNWL